jgi:hypothetical protein
MAGTINRIFGIYIGFKTRIWSPSPETVGTRSSANWLVRKGQMYQACDIFTDND